jgi:hypothetical protein
MIVACALAIVLSALSIQAVKDGKGPFMGAHHQDTIVDIFN